MKMHLIQQIFNKRIRSTSSNSVGIAVLTFLGSPLTSSNVITNIAQVNSAIMTMTRMKATPTVEVPDEVIIMEMFATAPQH